ncbi:MAG: alginate export family protein [Phycisphaerae bacterium]|nr:alginate export family protein [Phycisphaerae bacterium]
MIFKPHHVALGVLTAGIALSAGLARAQDGRTGRDIYAEQLRVRLDEQIPEAREAGFDAGGWFNFAIFNYLDGPSQETRTMRSYELRLWGSANVGGVHRGYVRALLGWENWNPGTYYIPGGENHFNDGIERAWYQFDSFALVRNRTGKRPPNGFRVKIGRQFATIGTGLVLSMPLDMIRFDAAIGDVDVTALLGQTLRHSRNIDDSDAVAGHQDRCFYGFELGYRGWTRHRPFVYFLSQSDHTGPDPSSQRQRYDYSSRYLGIGSEGALSDKLQYRAELVGEWGRTYSNGATTGQDDICAMALDMELAYHFDVPTKPRVTAEYLFATGDSDRGTSATATVGGNTAGTDDEAFNAFGFRDTGIAFSPRISNLHMYALGGSCFPLERFELFERMKVGTKVFFYHKDESAGAISDTSANNDARCLGWEWDVYADWRITSDLAWTIRYGIFQPSGAFDGGDKSSRHFLYTGLVFSF